LELRQLRPLLRRIKYAWLAPQPAATPPEAPLPPFEVHDLTKNTPLSAEDYAHCVALGQGLQALYDGAPAYIKQQDLDPEIFLPGNEWAGIVPTSGLKFRADYNWINYLRLHAPFAGFHMPILDRLDSGAKFPREGTTEFVTKLSAEGIPDDIAEQQRKRFPAGERLQHAIPEYLDHIRNMPSQYIVHTPRMFGEIGLEIDEVLVNPDVTLCQSRINALYCSGILDKLASDIERRGQARILEIGAGHGSLAYALQQIFGNRLEYVIVDLPSSLFYATMYLSVLGGRDRCHLLAADAAPPEHFLYLFIANHLFERAIPHLGHIDLAINCMSFPEMSAAQIRYYGQAIKCLIGDDGVLFEENAALAPHHTDCKAIFEKIFPHHLHITSQTVTTKNWCQDIWATRDIGKSFECNDVATPLAKA
jgi:putative sugar O-methyltransferase